MPFRNILGQSIPIQQLQNALQSERLSHCYLFSGPAASGKTTTARALAATLLCESPKKNPPDACGECNACMQVSHETHPDVIGITAEGASIRIQQIRTLRSRLSRSAYSGGYSVVLIHEAERLTTESANALLKTLEEPLGPIVFILLTNQPEALPHTIQSRCQLLRFQSLKLTDLDRLLQDGEADVLRRACALRYSEGNACDPRALLAEEGEDARLPQLVKSREALFAFLHKLPTQDPGQIIRFLQPFGRDKDMLFFLLRLIRSYYTDCLAVSVYADAPLHNPDQQTYDRQHPPSPETVLAILDCCDTAQRRMDANVDAEQALAVCLMKIAGHLRTNSAIPTCSSL